MYDYDLLVIGAGSGGLSAAQTAAKHGARVAIADPHALGGTCVNRGCIPKKLMTFAANFARQQRSAKSYGWVNPSACDRFDWPALRVGIEQHLDTLRQSYHSKLTKAGVTLLRCAARFVEPHKVELSDRTISVDKVIIASGAKPLKPPLPGIECGLSSRDIFTMVDFPHQFTIVGGGYIGAEFSNIFCTLGSQVTLIDKNDCILPGFDTDIRQAIHGSLMNQGIRVLSETALEGIEKRDDGMRISLSGRCDDTLIADTLLLALGRVPNIASLNLDAAGVKVDNGAISVDDCSRTSQSSIFAVGDCTNRLPLTPVAIAEGRAAATTLFGGELQSVNYRWVPSAVFCSPEAATVGWTEEEARAKVDGEVGVRCARFTPLRYALTDQEQQTLIKLVVNEQTQTILGMHMVGDEVAEIIQGFIPALSRGLTLAELSETIALHPTVAEEIFDFL